MHIPVLLEEVLKAFSDCNILHFLDVTLGVGGHASALLKSHPEILRYYGCDKDSVAIRIAEKNLEEFSPKLRIYQKAFSTIREDIPIAVLDGILADIGLSSLQLDSDSRGFSFKSDDAYLDMRMNVSSGKTAADILNRSTEKELGKIFKELGEEPLWRQVAEAVVKFREREKFSTVKSLKTALKFVFPSFRLRKKINPLTLVFQALRLCVNNELEELKKLINDAFDLLAPGGRFVCISFHSLEDRIIKWSFREAQAQGLGKIITKKPVSAVYEEIKKNRRSRSAKLRIFEKNSL